MNLKKKFHSLLFIWVVFSSTFVAIAFSSTAATVAETTAAADERIFDLRENLLKNVLKPEGSPIIGWAHDDSGKLGLDGELGTLAQENMIGIAALSKNFQATGNVESDNWAQADIWRVINNMAAFQESSFGVLMHKDAPDDEYRAIDYFMFLEFIGESKSLTGSSEMDIKLNDLFIRKHRFYSNSTQGGIDGKGSWITHLKSGEQFKPTVPNAIDYQNSLTNNSLWAAAGFSTYSLAVRGTASDNTDGYSVAALIEAEESIAFADAYTFNRLYGLYMEDMFRTNASQYSILANTQVVALLACARLSQATGKEIYMHKASSIMDSLMRYFWDTGRGGLYSSYNPSTGQVADSKNAYDNSLFAYALIQLAKVRDLEEFNIGYFIRGKGQNEYFNMAKDVMNYLYNWHWKESESKRFMGYVEWINHDGGSAGPSELANSTRLAKSNMLSLYVLANIIYGSREFYVVYQMYLIIGGSVLGVIILVSVLVIRKSREGTSLSKVTKGLLASGDDD